MRASSNQDARSVIDSIRQIVRAIRLSSRASEKAHGLSGAQIFVLQKLGESDALSLNELAERTLTHQSSVSVVVAKLAEQGLVSRSASREDGRRIEISLTRKGLELLKKALETPQEKLLTAIRALDSASRAQLALTLGQVVKHAGFALTPPPLLFEDEPKVSSARTSKKKQATELRPHGTRTSRSSHRLD